MLPAVRAHARAAHVPAPSQMETVSKKDAMQFPLIGSAVLFGLYCVIKLVKKEYLDALISVYFALLGSFGIFGMIGPPLTNALGLADLKRFEKSIHYKFWRARDSEFADPIEISCSWWDVVLFLPCAGASIAYAVTKKWWLNNLLGCAFSVQGIEMLALGSYAIGCILLCGLFVYAPRDRSNTLALPLVAHTPGFSSTCCRVPAPRTHAATTSFGSLAPR